MPTFADVISQKIARLNRRIDTMQGVFECVTVSPFTVYLNGDTSVAVPALKLTETTYSIGTKGRYLLAQGGQPLCFPTA